MGGRLVQARPPSAVEISDRRRQLLVGVPTRLALPGLGGSTGDVEQGGAVTENHLIDLTSETNQHQHSHLKGMVLRVLGRWVLPEQDARVGSTRMELGQEWRVGRETSLRRCAPFMRRVPAAGRATCDRGSGHPNETVASSIAIVIPEYLETHCPPRVWPSPAPSSQTDRTRPAKAAARPLWFHTLRQHTACLFNIKYFALSSNGRASRPPDSPPGVAVLQHAPFDVKNMLRKHYNDSGSFLQVLAV